MAVSYISPATYQNQLPAMPMGPLSGFLAGMNQDLANQATMRGFADDDLQRQLNQQRLDELTQGQQSRLDVLGSEAAKANADKQYYQSGVYGAAETAKGQADIAQSDLAKTNAGVQQTLAYAPLINQFSQEAEAKAATYNPMDKNDQAWWEGWRDKLKAVAPNMPYAPDQGDFQKAAMWGKQASEAYVNSIQMQQKVREAAVAPEINQKTALGVEDKRAASNETVAQINAGSREKVADINSTAKVAVANLLMNKAAQGQARVQAIMDRASKTGWTPDLVSEAEYAQKEVEMGREWTKLKGTVDFQNPDALQALDKSAEEQAVRTLSANPGYAKAKRDMLLQENNGGGGGQPTGQPAPTSSMPSGQSPIPGAAPRVSSKSMYDALPVGATYIDERDGHTKVKGK